MKTASHTFKYCRYLCLLVCLLSGCAKGPRQQGIWPWEYGKETGNYQTGDYVTVSGPVGHFGEPPKAAKPIAPETLEPQAPASPPPAKPQEAKTETPSSQPTAGTPASAKAVDNVRGTYDFSVESVKTAQPSYMPAYPGQTTYDITAINHGDAPVSVTIGADPKASVNLHTDKNLPLTAVVPPHTEQALVHCGPKMKSEPFSLKYTFSWSIGDYRTSHNSPEHYRLPFGRNTRAYVNVADKASATQYTRYSVIFSMPAGTPVLAARKGTVVRIKADDRIDMLHDDATIATYNHL